MARRMLLAFLLLGIIPAAITLGVGQRQAREALLACEAACSAADSPDRRRAQHCFCSLQH